MEEMNNNVVENTETEVKANGNSKADIGIAAGLLAAAGYGVYSLGKNIVNGIRAKRGKDPVGITTLFKGKKKAKAEVKVEDDTNSNQKGEKKSK